MDVRKEEVKRREQEGNKGGGRTHGDQRDGERTKETREEKRQGRKERREMEKGK